jgi:hypothetical protein
MISGILKPRLTAQTVPRTLPLTARGVLDVPMKAPNYLETLQFLQIFQFGTNAAMNLRR